MVHTGEILLAGITPTQTQLHLAYLIHILHETLVVDAPCKSGTGEEAPLVALSKTAATVSTSGEGEQITVHQTVVGTSKP